MKKKDEKPKVHPDLEGFDMKVNENGEIISTFSIEEINKFLDKNVVDKKLKNRDDLDVKKDENEED